MRELDHLTVSKPAKTEVMPISDLRRVHGELEDRLIKGMEEGIQHQSLLPLIEQIVGIMKLLRQSPKKKGFTVFSCDSFCQPHYEMQQCLLGSLRSAFCTPITYIQAPASHYLLSSPDHVVTKIFENLTLVKETNNCLYRRQKFQPEVDSYQANFFWFADPLVSIGNNLKRLLEVVPKQEWDSILLDDFPFHELAYRDLTNTYKLDFGPHSEIEPYRPTIRAGIVLMFLTLLGFVLNKCYSESNIGSGFYSGNNVFRFFCKSIDATYVYMDGAQLDVSLFGSDPRKIIRLLNTPIDIAYINTTRVATAIFRAKLGRFSRRRVERLIALKTRGLGSHTYSKSIHCRDQAAEKFIDLCNGVVSRGAKIVSMFSSSADELAGQLLAYRHESINLSHLSVPIFDSQQDWMIKTIIYFGQFRPDDLLVVRIHPRLAADHRGLLSSPGLEVLMSELEAYSIKYNNIYIVHPSSTLSSYLIGSKSELIINGWSTIGLDFAIMGYKVIYGFPKCYYGGGAFHAVFDNIDAYSNLDHYFAVIDQALQNCQCQDLVNAFVIRPELACKAYIVIHLAGCITVDKKEELQSQITNPQILTDYLVKLITEDYPVAFTLRSLIYSLLRYCVGVLRSLKYSLKPLFVSGLIPRKSKL